MAATAASSHASGSRGAAARAIADLFVAPGVGAGDRGVASEAKRKEKSGVPTTTADTTSKVRTSVVVVGGCGGWRCWRLGSSRKLSGGAACSAALTCCILLLMIHSWWLAVVFSLQVRTALTPVFSDCMVSSLAFEGAFWRLDFGAGKPFWFWGGIFPLVPWGFALVPGPPPVPPPPPSIVARLPTPAETKGSGGDLLQPAAPPAATVVRVARTQTEPPGRVCAVAAAEVGDLAASSAAGEQDDGLGRQLSQSARAATDVMKVAATGGDADIPAGLSRLKTKQAGAAPAVVLQPSASSSASSAAQQKKKQEEDAAAVVAVGGGRAGGFLVFCAAPSKEAQTVRQLARSVLDEFLRDDSSSSEEE